MNEDFIDINTVTPVQRFSVELSKVRLKFDMEHKPFDEQCARLDFRDKLDVAEKESERRHGFIDLKEIKVEIGDLNRYGDDGLFEFIDEQPHLQDKVIEGSRTQVLTGYIRNYRCKKRGHGLSVFIPIADYKKKEEKSK